MADGLDLRERQAPAPDGSPHRARKPTKRWCRGKVGREHVTEIRVDKSGWRAERSCSRAYYLPDFWYCLHREVCVNCGKILRHGIDRDCPAFTTEITIRWPAR